MNIVQNGVFPSKKQKTKTADSSSMAHQSPSKAIDPSVNVTNYSHPEPSASGDVFRRKKLKLTPIHDHM